MVAAPACGPRRRGGRAALAGRRAASCTRAPRVVSRCSASTSMGTSLSVMATSTSRWCGVSSLDGAAQRCEQLAGLRVRGGPGGGGRDQLPALGVKRDLAAVPGPAPCLHAGLEQGELVRPGGEAAGAAVVAELRQDRHERVVGALLCEVRGVRSRTAARDLEAGGAEQEVVQALHGAVALQLRTTAVRRATRATRRRERAGRPGRRNGARDPSRYPRASARGERRTPGDDCGGQAGGHTPVGAGRGGFLT